MEPQIRFCTSADGVRIAYTTLGDGLPLVRVPRYAQGIELMWRDEEAGAFYGKLGQGRRLVMVERRGVGHSQREVDDVSMAAHIADVRAATDHLGLDRFAMFGDGDAAAVCIAYAAAHPEQVSRLILWGGYARSGPVRSKETGLSLADVGGLSWLLACLAIANLFFPSGLVERQRRIGRFWEQCISLEMGLKYMEFVQDINVVGLLPKIACPALVLQRRGDQTGHTLEMSREIARLIPEARLVIVEGDIGLPEYDHEQVVQVITEFLAEGEPLPQIEPSAPGGLVTILFTDVEGSTALTQRLGDAKAQEVLRTHNTIVRDALKAHGGSEVKTMGDGFMASFSLATRALECAIAMQRAFAQHNESAEELVRVRIGLNAGEPIAEEEDLFGTAVIEAARIAATAEGGEILVANVVRELAKGKGFLFADRGDVALRGFEDPVRLYELRWERPEKGGGDGS